MASRKKKAPPEPDLAGLKARTLELLSQDRGRLLLKMPFIGSLLMRLDLVPVRDERLPTAATDGDRVFVDIGFYSKLSAEERLFVLAHETWHCALIHFVRRQGRNPVRFNIAADLEIQFLLADEGLKAPFALPHDPDWKGLSCEEIYERYPKTPDDAAKLGAERSRRTSGPGNRGRARVSTGTSRRGNSDRRKTAGTRITRREPRSVAARDCRRPSSNTGG